MVRRQLVGIPAAGLICLAGCNSPIAPETRNPENVHVTGRVLAFHGPSEFRAMGGADLLGWVDAGDGGAPTGRIPLDENGRFDLVVPRGARVRLYAGGTTSNERYQPCAVTITAAGNVHRDVRIVDDYDVIGAAVPPVFLEHTRILSGVVSETIPGGGRRPVPFATVTVGGYANGRTSAAGPSRTRERTMPAATSSADWNRTSARTCTYSRTRSATSPSRSWTSPATPCSTSTWTPPSPHRRCCVAPVDSAPRQRCGRAREGKTQSSERQTRKGGACRARDAQSRRSAVSGSTDDARSAGTRLANAPATSSVTAVVTWTIGSPGETFESSACICVAEQPARPEADRDADGRRARCPARAPCAARRAGWRRAPCARRSPACGGGP